MLLYTIEDYTDTLFFSMILEVGIQAVCIEVNVIKLDDAPDI